MACTVCGEQLDVGVVTCPACGAAAPEPEAPPLSDEESFTPEVTTQPWPPPPVARRNRPTSVRSSPPPTPPTEPLPGTTSEPVTPPSGAPPEPLDPVDLVPIGIDRPPGTILDEPIAERDSREQRPAGPAPIAVAAVVFLLVAGIGALAAVMLFDDGDDTAADPTDTPTVDADEPAIGGIGSRDPADPDADDPAAPSTVTLGSGEADSTAAAEDEGAGQTPTDPDDGGAADGDESSTSSATSTGSGADGDADDGAPTTAPTNSTATTAPSTTSTTAAPVPIAAGRITAVASSSLPSSGGFTYGPGNVLDGDLSTAWNDDTGAGAAAGQFLRFDFAEPVDLVRVEVVNGYAKNNSVFARNEAARTVRLTTDTGVTAEATLTKTKAPQSIAIDAPGATRVTLTVVDVHPGEEFSGLEPFTDLAITDVSFTAAG